MLFVKLLKELPPLTFRIGSYKPARIPFDRRAEERSQEV